MAFGASVYTDNFEQHDFEAVQGSPHPIFLKLKLVGELGIWHLVQVSIG
jgi:hypothetical protein